MDVLLRRSVLIEQPEHIFFNPFLSEFANQIKTEFISGKRHYFVMRGTGFNIGLQRTKTNDVLDLNLQYSFIASVFHHLNIYPVTYQGENNGKLFRAVTPVKKFEHSKSSFGSKKNLGFHVDNNHMALRNETPNVGCSSSPDYLSLFCVRNDEKIPTLIADIQIAYATLSCTEQKILQSPRFKIHYPDSFDTKGSVVFPVITENEHGIFSRFDAAFTEPLDTAAKKAFNRLNDVLKQAQIPIYFDSGDMLIFRNQKIAHARKSFTPKYNGYDRFLIRTFGLDHLNNISRVSFEDPYHATSY